MDVHSTMGRASALLCMDKTLDATCDGTGIWLFFCLLLVKSHGAASELSESSSWLLVSGRRMDDAEDFV